MVTKENSIRVVPYNQLEFKKVFYPNETASSQIEYIAFYLENGAKNGALPLCTGMVIEEVYHSHDFIAEYSAYYSECFSGLPRHSRRVHFFGDLELQKLRSALKDALTPYDPAKPKEEERCKVARRTLQENYLGFSAVRPVPGARIGFTALRTWDTEVTTKDKETEPREKVKVTGIDRKVEIPEAGGWKRYYLTREVTAHLAGIPLTVTASPFMQQDRAVAACASTSIWMALQVLPQDLFPLSRATTVDITAHATKYRVKNRASPARKGLDEYQMSEAFRSLGCAPEVFNIEDETRLRILARANLMSGRPLVLTAIRVDEPSYRAHALTVLGFAERDEFLTWDAEAEPESSFTLRMPAPTELYISDDRHGPCASVKIKTMIPDRDFEPSYLKPLSYPKDKRLPGFVARYGKGGNIIEEQWIVVRAHVPRYHAVHLNIQDLILTNRDLFLAMAPEVLKETPFKELDMDCYLQLSSSLLAEIVSIPLGNCGEHFLRNITLPRFVGVANLSGRNPERRPLFTFIWDTTDFCRGEAMSWEHLFAVIIYNDKVRNRVIEFLHEEATEDASIMVV